MGLTEEEANALFSVNHWPEPFRAMHGLLWHDCHDLERWPEPYRSGFRRAGSLRGQQQWEQWASNEIWAQYRARSGERKNAAIRLLDEILLTQVDLVGSRAAGGPEASTKALWNRRTRRQTIQ